MKRLLALLLILFCPDTTLALVKITASEVYSQVMQIDKEVDLLLQHFNISRKKIADTYRADLRPRHVWVKTYIIMVKINVLRNKLGLPRNEPNYMAPEDDYASGLVFEQTQRLQAELHILKKLLGIQGNTELQQFNGKRPIDVFNRLHHVSYQ
ncbi:MAG: hypothetical protein D3923_09210, partial [Candidatus Electrothrix sp. AR3]|nr:hypothetical protein [Candidatus Electrothrix sp. AR3]